jgi:hypothetical protein
VLYRCYFVYRHLSAGPEGPGPVAAVAVLVLVLEVADVARCGLIAAAGDRGEGRASPARGPWTCGSVRRIICHPLGAQPAPSAGKAIMPTRRELRYGRAPLVLIGLAVLAAVFNIGTFGTGTAVYTQPAGGGPRTPVYRHEYWGGWVGWVVFVMLVAAVVLGVVSFLLYLRGLTHPAIVALVAGAICGAPAFWPPLLAALVLLIISRRRRMAR